jgi:hypothetical protein
VLEVWLELEGFKEAWDCKDCKECKGYKDYKEPWAKEAWLALED